MLILGLLGMYFDATVVFVTSQTLLLRLAVAILWYISYFLQMAYRFFFSLFLDPELHNTCWLKKDVSGRIDKEGVISGFICNFWSSMDKLF